VDSVSAQAGGLEEEADAGTLSGMKALNQEDVRSVKERLEVLIARIETILTFSDRDSSQFNLDRARHLLRDLKDHFQKESRRMDTVKGIATLSPAEQAWYAPAVHESWANCIGPARINQHQQTWRKLLDEAVSEIRWHLDNIKSSQKPAADTK
jgi:hypothetical protein